MIENSKAPKVQTEPLNEPLDNKLPLINQKILEQISNNPRITYNELAIFLNVSRSSVKRAMNKLTNTGLIERVGGKRYGHWRILR